MYNHVHLIIDNNGNDISKMMKSINLTCTVHFNKVYKKIGYLFQGHP